MKFTPGKYTLQANKGEVDEKGVQKEEQENQGRTRMKRQKLE